MQHTYKIVIPYLVFENERIEVPIGLSELLEPAWSKQKENDAVQEVASKFNRKVYKGENGQWVTKFELKEGQAQ